MTAEQVLDQVKPYDIDPKEALLKAFNSDLRLTEYLDKELKDKSDWVQAAEKDAPKFIFCDLRSKRFPFTTPTNSLELKFVGKDRKPTLEVTLYNNDPFVLKD